MSAQSGKENVGELDDSQKRLCAEYHVYPVPAPLEIKSGFALATKGLQPVNGLRHYPENGTTGWYIWCGEAFSKNPDFFAPVHTSHIYESYPELKKLLGLPPGYRFLLDGDYLDVWFDPTLLE